MTPTSRAPATDQHTDRVRTVFRTVAFAEAISWAGLLIGMLFKYVISGSESGVHVFGPIHGVVFVAYVISCFVARSRFGWSPGTTLLALASSIPPFFTAVFEVWVDRTGRIDAAQRMTTV